MLPADPPVLVVGAGLGGLSTALFLGVHGVPALVVDAHPATSSQPKARGQMPAVMEAFRVAGVDGAIRGAAPPGRAEMTVVIARSVAGEVLHSFTDSVPDFAGFSPAPFGFASQAAAESVIAERARELGARLRFRTRLEALRQDGDGVTATLLDLDTGDTVAVRTRYVVAADGHRGTIRQQLGIGTHGRGSFDTTTTVRFAADLTGVVSDAAVLMYYLQAPELPGGHGVIVSTDRPGEYVAGMRPDPDRDDAGTVEVIRRLTGVPDLDVAVLGASTWDIAHRVADRFAERRVFLVGDAAHLMPPTGGQGGNTAVLDGYHLAWRLAAVLHGHAREPLLDSYDVERRPYAEAVCDWQFANMVERQAPHLRDATTPTPMDAARLAFGYRCADGAIVPDTTGPADDDPFEDPAEPSGRPGTRAPHVRLRRGTVPVSTRDLFGENFVLLTDDPVGPERARNAGARLGLAIDAHVITPDGRTGTLTDEGGFTTTYGLPPGAAVLVRPDGVIGWRGNGEAAAISTALSQILCR